MAIATLTMLKVSDWLKTEGKNQKSPKPGVLEVALDDDGGLFNVTRDDGTAPAAVTDEDDEDELIPRAKFSNGITT